MNEPKPNYMTAKVRHLILFQDLAGQPIPRLPYSPDGTLRQPDAALRSLHEAESMYGLAWRWLWNYWYETLHDFMTPAMRTACKPPADNSGPNTDEDGEDAYVVDGVYLGP